MMENDGKKAYLSLFNAVTDAVKGLQEARFDVQRMGFEQEDGPPAPEEEETKE